MRLWDSVKLSLNNVLLLKDRSRNLRSVGFTNKIEIVGVRFFRYNKKSTRNLGGRQKKKIMLCLHCFVHQPNPPKTISVFVRPLTNRRVYSYPESRRGYALPIIFFRQQSYRVYFPPFFFKKKPSFFNQKWHC